MCGMSLGSIPGSITTSADVIAAYSGEFRRVARSEAEWPKRRLGGGLDTEGRGAMGVACAAPGGPSFSHADVDSRAAGASGLEPPLDEVATVIAD